MPLVSTAVLLTALSSPALACGGFFCDNVDPVVQKAERILFRDDGNGQVTTFVEVQFDGPAQDFAWVLPIPEPIDPKREISVAPAGLFDELEVLTAPQFVLAGGESADAAYMDAGSSCGGFGGGGDSFEPDTSGVELVGEAVVGPFEIDIITAEVGTNLATWLQGEGYQIPFSASGAMQHYIDEGYAFIGLKLRPGVGTGAIDTLVLSCAADAPRIPLILTAVASAPQLEVVAYVLAEERHVPENFTDLDFPYEIVAYQGDGRPDYQWHLIEEVAAAGGQAWNTEYAAPVSAQFISGLSPASADALGSGRYLTRFHSFIAPQDMTVDPSWVADPQAPDVDNVHVVGEASPYRRAALPLASLLPVLMLGVGAWRRR